MALADAFDTLVAASVYSSWECRRIYSRINCEIKPQKNDKIHARKPAAVLFISPCTTVFYTYAAQDAAIPLDFS